MNYELKEDYELCTMHYELKDYAVFFKVLLCCFVAFGHKKAARFTTNRFAFTYHLC